MAAQESEPLLDESLENTDFPTNNDQLKSLFENDKILRGLSNNSFLSNRASIAGTGVICVFVVAFDTKAGLYSIEKTTDYCLVNRYFIYEQR